MLSPPMVRPVYIRNEFYYIKCIPYLPFNFFQLAIKCARLKADHI